MEDQRYFGTVCISRYLGCEVTFNWYKKYRHKARPISKYLQYY